VFCESCAVVNAALLDLTRADSAYGMPCNINGLLVPFVVFHCKPNLILVRSDRNRHTSVVARKFVPDMIANKVLGSNECLYVGPTCGFIR
jgi:hypothetical protein